MFQKEVVDESTGELEVVLYSMAEDFNAREKELGQLIEEGKAREENELEFGDLYYPKEKFFSFGSSNFELKYADAEDVEFSQTNNEVYIVYNVANQGSE